MKGTRLGFVRLMVTLFSSSVTAQNLQEQLQQEDVGQLVADALNQGDARRGAILFFHPRLACTQCHAADDAALRDGILRVGPEMVSLPETLTHEGIVQAILEPSAAIREGFATTAVETDDGQTLVGRLLERNDESLKLLPPTSDRPLTIPVEQVIGVASDQPSMMPTGLANQLTTRQEFLDLVRYLIEIKESGAQRARELRPNPSLYAVVLPEYESHVDHASLLSDLNQDSFQRGQEIYSRLCINCHGDHQAPGSLPTAPRFGQTPLKNGSDPYSMYRTLTHGFGFMVAQTWMVPRQKYDVIHYIREDYFKERADGAYTVIDATYLESLPKGDTLGPEPVEVQPWAEMDYGPSLINTYEVPRRRRQSAPHFVYKGIAVRVDPGAGGVARGRAWMLFDHDLMSWAAAWTAKEDQPRFINWHGIHFDGRHNAHPQLSGELIFTNPQVPGWGEPETGTLADLQRVFGRDDRKYGPLPRHWARYLGTYACGDRTVIEYAIGDTVVQEVPGLIDATLDTASAPNQESTPVFTRGVRLSERSQHLRLVVATGSPNARLEIESGMARLIDDQRADQPSLIAMITGRIEGFEWSLNDEVPGTLCLEIPPGKESRSFAIAIAQSDDANLLAAVESRVRAQGDIDAALAINTPRWPDSLTLTSLGAESKDAFEVEVIPHPEMNPWLAQIRLTGIDFLSDGHMLLTAWDGDVWRVKSSTRESGEAIWEWKRVASGLFQPLGIKTVDDVPYVTCRDQLVILRDRNGDGEYDHFDCFNNDHQVTEHFHEFAMGLQRDDAGNFYYAKSARHALTALVPHHGTLLRVSADGTRTDIIANGFRAANGVCLNPDGTFIVTDQEGHWNPKNRINWVHEGGFYGNMFGYHDVTDSSDEAMQPPLCWITNAFDRSPSELLWVDQPSWGNLNGRLLNLSYGNGKVFVVPHEDRNGVKQGGMCALPIEPFPTGVMRGRFGDQGYLYLCGMFAWAGDRTQPGGFYRIRPNGKPVTVPVALQATPGALSIELSDPVNMEAAADPSRYVVKVWGLVRSANYGSPHVDEHQLIVESVSVAQEGRRVTLKLPQLAPTWCMQVKARWIDSQGNSIERVIHNSIHKLED